jgi:hypothetical protein
MVFAFPHQQVADYTTWVSGTRVKKHHKRKEWNYCSKEQKEMREAYCTIKDRINSDMRSEIRYTLMCRQIDKYDAQGQTCQ